MMHLAGAARECRMTKVSTRGLIRRILLLILVTSLVAGAGGVYTFLRQRALEQAVANARLMLVTAVAVRSYTNDFIVPVLERLPADKFYKMTVPSFAAHSVYRAVQATYPAYTYRESALNPTNPDDRPTSFEVEMINRFRANAQLEELRGVRDSDDGSVFYLSRPIKITQGACLRCHSTPDLAPAAMIAQYGPINGFGWKLDEIIGIQTLTVPVEQELRGAAELAILIAGGLLVVFFVIYWALTLSLDTAVVRPLVALARAAEEASKSSDQRIVLPRAGAEEVQTLADAIERLRVSVLKAIAQITARRSASKS
jgi:protein-histidine pros-kinase